MNVPRLHRFDILAAWFREYLQEQGYRPRTVKDYTFEMSFFRRYLWEKTDIGDLDDFTTQTVRDYASYLYDKGNSAVSIYHKLAGLRNFFAAAYERKKLYVDYRSAIDVPRIGPRLPADILTEEDARKLFAYLEESTRALHVRTRADAVTLGDRAILEVLYSTGVRRAELCGLALGDIDYDSGLVFIREGKGGRDRVIPIGTTALECVRRYVLEARPVLAATAGKTHGKAVATTSASTARDALFLTINGRPLAAHSMALSVKRTVAASGLGKRLRIHAMRHTCATHLLNHGADIRFVQELLGHARLSSTQIYTHVSIGKLKEIHARHHPREKGEI